MDAVVSDQETSAHPSPEDYVPPSSGENPSEAPAVPFSNNSNSSKRAPRSMHANDPSAREKVAHLGFFNGFVDDFDVTDMSK
mmetsp:Transcript_12719/g.23008  ORF Transcript_12719/g.23008 Transcript_12719/m.23008 type:complete len:82 (-) Transcript_12719:340-585(-)|eukprot:CAMPEP_0198280052 /NCGR_PEP_ID=MMETSP1449-20131203/220_1 /TAXON_ID=420275 /ORGANISM="Attheya septentrionalis, Strain CCMP2084" /LENGTH=81 /DNA_ID=CAMNT_0043975315 /DNA_START=346 /DNA_END=591 /DNA_ORIENTATION=+